MKRKMEMKMKIKREMPKSANTQLGYILINSIEKTKFNWMNVWRVNLSRVVDTYMYCIY